MAKRMIVSVDPPKAPAKEATPPMQFFHSGRKTGDGKQKGKTDMARGG